MLLTILRIWFCMPSKQFDLWELLQFKQDLQSLSVSIQVLLPEAGITSYVKNLVQSALGADKTETFVGQHLPVDWAIEKVYSLSLFGNTPYLIVTGAEKISAQEFNAIDSDQLNQASSSLILITQKELKFKNADIKTVKLKAPKFWEWQKVIQFLASENQLKLGAGVDDLIEKVETPSFSKIHAMIKRLELFYPEEIITREKFTALYPLSALDRFALADLLNQKKMTKLWGLMDKSQAGSHELREVVSFLMGHLLKIYDPAYTQDKKQLSQYDRKILSAHNVWQVNEIESVLEKFRELEQACKLKQLNYQKLLKQNSLRPTL